MVCLRTPIRQLLKDMLTKLAPNSRLSVEHRKRAAVREFSLNESMARRLLYRLVGLVRLIIQCTGRRTGHEGHCCLCRIALIGRYLSLHTGAAQTRRSRDQTEQPARLVQRCHTVMDYSKQRMRAKASATPPSLGLQLDSSSQLGLAR